MRWSNRKRVLARAGAGSRGSTPQSLKPVALEAAVERAPAQPERLCRLADVAGESRHGLLDQEALHLFEAHVLDARGRVALDPQAELRQPDARSGGHEDAAFHGVIELADVAGPGM